MFFIFITKKIISFFSVHSLHWGTGPILQHSLCGVGYTAPNPHRPFFVMPALSADINQHSWRLVFQPLVRAIAVTFCTKQTTTSVDLKTIQNQLSIIENNEGLKGLDKASLFYYRFNLLYIKHAHIVDIVYDFMSFLLSIIRHEESLCQKSISVCQLIIHVFTNYNNACDLQTMNVIIYNLFHYGRTSGYDRIFFLIE